MSSERLKSHERHASYKMAVGDVELKIRVATSRHRKRSRQNMERRESKEMVEAELQSKDGNSNDEEIEEGQILERSSVENEVANFLDSIERESNETRRQSQDVEMDDRFVEVSTQTSLEVEKAILPSYCERAVQTIPTCPRRFEEPVVPPLREDVLEGPSTSNRTSQSIRDRSSSYGGQRSLKDRETYRSTQLERHYSPSPPLSRCTGSRLLNLPKSTKKARKGEKRAERRRRMWKRMRI